MVAVPHPRLRPYTSPLFISLPPQRRQTEVSNLRALIDKRITDAKNEMASELSTLSADVRAALEGISETVSKLTQAVSAETEARKSEGQILARAVLDRVEKLGNKVEDERASRLEAEARVTMKVHGDLRRVQEVVDAEVSRRGAALLSVEQRVAEQVQKHGNGQEEFERAVMAELAAIRAELEAEREARATEDDAIVRTLETNTERIQDALKTVMTSM